jgi:hypothetical protein
MWSPLLSSHLYDKVFLFLSSHRKFHMNWTSFKRSYVLWDHFYLSYQIASSCRIRKQICPFWFSPQCLVWKERLNSDSQQFHQYQQNQQSPLILTEWIQKRDHNILRWKSRSRLGIGIIMWQSLYICVRKWISLMQDAMRNPFQAKHNNDSILKIC